MTREELNVLFTYSNTIGPWAQNPEELWKLVEKLNVLKPTRILEIGVQSGASLRVWSDIAGPEGQVFGLDLNDTAQRMEFNTKPTMIIGDSSVPKTISKVKELISELDFLFIDGDHYGNGPQSDWDNYSPLVRKGGMVAFHDTHINEIKTVFNRINYRKEIYDHQFGIGVIFIE